jgi:lipopolysaccharide transport system ATP-binding protein
MTSDITISIENLSKKYQLRHPIIDSEGKLIRELWALKDISIAVTKGQCLGIVGPNGSGKSTLLKILAGITPPTAGKVEITGRVASILDIGAGFHPELSGRENVFLNGHLLGFSKKEIAAKFEEIVVFSGIEKFIEEPVKNYSSGMFLRLAFSVLAHLDAEILILDEVISAGDADFQLKCKNTIRNFVARKKTIIMVSHNLNELANNCSHIMLLEKGRLVAHGQTEVLDLYLKHSLPDHYFLKNNINYHISHEILPSTLFDAITIISASLKDFTIKPDGIAGEMPMKIEFQMSVNVPSFSCNVGIHCRHVTDISVFMTLVENINAYKHGIYILEFDIPAHLFNSDIYSIDFIVINQKQEVQRINRIITFKIVAGGNIFNKKLPGIVKPKIDYKVYPNDQQPV